MAPEVLFGSGFWCTQMTDFRDASAVADLLDTLKHYNITRIDTAARYPPMKIGGAETLLGENHALCRSFAIDTKVLVSNINDTSGHLSADAIEKSIADSLARLGLDSVDILYAHLPDPATPIADQIVAFNSQVERGRCRQYGLCNHSVEQVRAILQLCEERGLRKPTVYQGEYNLMTRGVESELLPLLKEHHIRYFAYRPLAAGFLTGKLVNGQADGTRMAKDSPMGPAYHAVYGSPVLHQAMQDFATAVEHYHFSPLEVAVRWIYHHSALADDDGMTLGTRSIEQLQQDMHWIGKGPLPQKVLTIVDNVWEKLKESRGSVL